MNAEYEKLVGQKIRELRLARAENCGPINDNPVNLAERYAKELCGDFGNGTGGFCDWNLLLSEQGGPFHNRSAKSVAVAGVVFEDKSRGCHAPILYDNETKQLVYTPIYYYIGHFSKYIERGAVRIATTKYNENIHTCAFKNPDGKIVLVMFNVTGDEMQAVVRHNDVCTTVNLEAHSAATIMM